MLADKEISSPQSPVMLTAKEVALRLNCASDYVSKLCREGKLKGRQEKKGWLVEELSIAAYERNRDAQKFVRAKELSLERKRELTAAAPFSIKPVLVALVLCLAIGTAALSFAAAVKSDIAATNNAAALARVESPFFGSNPVMAAFELGSAIRVAIANWFAPQHSTIAQPNIPAPSTTTPASTVTATSTTIVQNTYPVVERVVERREVAEMGDLTAQFNGWADVLRGEWRAQVDGIYDSLKRTGGGGISTITDADVPDTLTASNYLPLAGGTLTGALTGTSATFATIVATNATTTNFWLDGIAQGCAEFDADGKLTSTGIDCGSGSGGGADGNWVYFGGSAIRLATTSNQVVIGASSTSTASKVQIVGGLTVDNATTTNATTTKLSATLASTTNLTISGIASGSILKTTTSGVVTAATAGSDYVANTTGDWTGTFDSQEGSYYLARANHTGVQLASTISDFDAAVNIYINASTTIPKTYSANTFTALQTLTGGLTTSALTLGSLNGPLQANNGVVSATTSVGVLYGGTGLTAAPSYGAVLVGNASGGYTLTATSSLGLLGSSSISGASVISYNSGTGVITTQGGTFGAGDYTFPNKITAPYASSTALTVSGVASTTNLVISGLANCTEALETNTSGEVVCGTDATGSGASFPFTPTTNYGALTNATSTPLWLQAGLQASSTSHFVNATTSLATISTLWLPQLTNSGLGVDANGRVYAAATTTYSSGLAYSGGNVTNTGVTSIAGTANQITASAATGAVTLSLPALLSLTQASSTKQSILDVLYVGRVATSTIRGDGVASILPYASSTAITVSGALYGAGLTTCNTNADKLLWIDGVFSCGTDQTTGGGGSDANWTFFNGSGIRLATTTNQVLIGHTSTSTLLSPLAKLGVFGGASIDYASTTGITASYASSTNFFADTATLRTLTISGLITSTATGANVLPYASSTALTVSGTGYFGTASTTNLTISSIASGNLLKTTTAGSVIAAVAGTDYATPSQVSAAYPFPLAGNATSTLTQFNGGLTAFASSTIGSGTQAGGLTISGGATTTGSAYIAGSTTIGAVTATHKLGVSTTNNAADGILIINSSSGANAAAEVRLQSSSATITFGVTNTSYVTPAFADRALLTAQSDAAGFDLVSLGGDMRFYTSGAPLVDRMRITAAGLVGIGTSTPAQLLSVHGNSYISGSSFFGGAITATSTLTISGIITSTATAANVLPYASSTALTVSGTGYFGTASTTNLTISSIASGNLLKTTTAGSVVAAVAGTDYENALTFTYPISRAANTVSLAFGTTTANTWGAQNTFTSLFATNASSTNATTTNLTVTTLASTTNLIISALGAAAGSCLTPTAAGNITTQTCSNFSYPFPSNATSTTLTFSSGLLSTASTTIGSGTQAGGLTISGGATTTGNTTLQGTLALTGTATLSSTLTISGIITSTATAANVLPYASSTALTVSGTGYFGTASTTNLTISSIASGNLLKTTTAGSVIAAVVGTDYESGLSFTYPITRSVNTVSLAFGTTTANTWGPLQTFSYASTTGISASYASSTSLFADTASLRTLAITGPITSTATAANTLPYASTTALTVSGSASTTNLTISGIVSGSILKTTTAGSVVAATLGTDYVNGSGLSGNCIEWGASNALTDAGSPCGTGSGDANWTYFNGSAIRLSTTTNQVLIGHTATSSATSKLEIVGGNILHIASSSPTLASSSATVSKTYDVAIAGRYAYLADYDAGLRIVDISNPKLPTAVGAFATGLDNTVSVAVSGKYAYIGDEAAGVKVIDVSNPGAPTLVGTYSGLTFPYDLAVSGKYVYALDYTGGEMHVLDASDPTAPTSTSIYTTGLVNPYGVVVQGKYAYIADQGNGDVVVVDISNPKAPTRAGTYATGVAPTSLYLSGKYLYVADAGGGFYILNVGTPTAPALVTGSTYNATGVYYGISVAGNYVYLSDHGGPVTVLNVSNPAAPTLVGSLATGDTPWGVTVSGKYAYVAANTAGLKIVDINGIDAPAAHIGSIEANTVNVSDTLAVGGDITAGGGLNVGISGIFSRGTISAYVASSTERNPVVANFMGGNVGIGTTSPYRQLAVGNGAVFGGDVIAAYFTATSSIASILPYASSTALTVSGTGYFATASTTALTISGIASGNLLKTTTGGSVIAAVAGTDYENALTFTYPISRAANTVSLAFGTTTANTWGAQNTFTSLFATNASSTNATTTNLHIIGLTNSGLGVDANGRVYAAATTTYGTGLTYSNGTVTNTGVTSLAGTANQITASAATGAVTLSLPNHVIFPGSFVAASASTTNATSTNLTVTTLASTTNLTISSIIANSLLKTTTAGSVVAAVAGTDYVTGAGLSSAFPFTPTTNFGATANATSTPIWFQAGLMASSTARLMDIDTIGLLSFSTSTTNATSTLVRLNGQTFLTASTTGANTGLGLNALANVTGGVVNTAVGALALRDNTTGSSNNAFGNAALQRNTTGGGNVAIGVDALTGNTTGDGNVAIGFNTHSANTSGSNNVAIGMNALSAASRSENVAVGYQAGSAITTGFANILLGAHTGAGNLTTGAGSIGIGNNTFFPSATANNQLNIGNFLFGTVPATSSAFRLPTTGALGIATSSPFATLSLHAINGSTNTTLFAIGSSTQSATSTLFSISNTGSTTIANGINITAGCYAINGTCQNPAFDFPFTPTTFGSTNANATSTLIGFTAGLYSLASSTIGSGTQAGGLTISGGATTTGNTTLQGTLALTGTATLSSTLTISGIITSTATAANVLPYASSTALTVSGTGYFGTASTTNLTISSIASGNLLKTTTAGSVVAAVAGTDYENALTFTYPISRAANTVSLAFGTTTANTWGAQNTFTSLFATNASSTNATTTNLTVTTLASTTNLIISALGAAAGSCLTPTAAGNITTQTCSNFSYPFPSNATTTQLAFNGGLTAAGATTTALAVTGSTTISSVFNSTFANTLGSTTLLGSTLLTNATTTNLAVLGVASTTQFYGAGLASCVSNNVLTWQSGLFGCEVDDQGAGGGSDFTFPTVNGAITAATTSPLAVFNAAYFGATGTTTITSAGLLGVGTTSPWGKFSVHANNGSTDKMLFAIGSSTASATTTLFSVDNTGAASTTYMYGAGLASCTSNNVLTWQNGMFGCEADDQGAGTFPFTPTTNFGVTVNATSTPIWFQAGFMASSTSYIASTTFQSTGFIGMASTSPWAFFSINPTAVLGSAPSFVIGSSTGTNFIVTNSGNVGLGTTSPWGKFSISAQNGETNRLLFAIASSTAASTTNFLTFSNTGVLSVGASDAATPTGIFNIDAISGTTTVSTLSLGNLNFDTNAGIVYLSDIPIDTGAANGVIQEQIIGLAGSTTLSIYGESDGASGVKNQRVGVATTTPWRSFSVVGTMAINGLTANATGDVLCLAAGGEITTDITPGSGVCGNSASDQRVKTNIVGISNALDKITQLEAVHFEWINPAMHGGVASSTGFIAQNLETIFPELVAQDTCRGDDCLLVSDGKVKTISVGGPEFQAYLVKAIQELNSKVDAIDSSTGQSSGPITFVALTEATSSIPLAATTVFEITQATTTPREEFASSTPWYAAFADASDSLKAGVEALGDTVVLAFNSALYATTGIFDKLFAKEIHTDKLCVSDASGEICVTKTELQALVASVQVPAVQEDLTPALAPEPSPASTSTQDSTPEPSPEPAPESPPTGGSEPEPAPSSVEPTIEPTPEPAPEPAPESSPEPPSPEPPAAEPQP